MRYNYEHATMVFGWLGVPFDEKETSMAVRVMRKFHIVLRDGLANHKGDMGAVATQISPSNKDIHPEPGTDCYTGWLGIRERFNQTYWERIWIYQEATGTAPTRFCCGNTSFDMVFVNAPVYMAHHFAEFTTVDFPFRDVARGPVFNLSTFRDDGVVKYASLLGCLISGDIWDPPPFGAKVTDGTWAYHTYGPHKRHHAKIEGRHIILKGFMVDQIATLSSIWKTNVFSTAEVQSWAPYNPGSIYAPTGQSMDEAFRITVLADMNVLTKSRGHMADFNLINAREEEMTADQSARRNEMNVALKTHSGVRRIGWTKAGRIGLVPPAAHVGDLLYILFGCQMTYILREQSEGVFRYVGDSYIHSIMDGELIANGTVEVGQEKTIILE
ncbi:MAG: hypothetical protein Q9181_004365 [Wetmoreana brouardii]